MKKTKIFLTLFAVVFFVACNSPTTKEETAGTNKEITPTDSVVNHGGHTANLTLNKGEKWQADSNTHVHVKALKSKVESFNEVKNVDLNTYHSLGKELQSELNQLVQDCKMKGEDHEALHHWLEPVLENTSAIQKATTVEAAKTATQRVSSAVHQFEQYFK